MIILAVIIGNIKEPMITNKNADQVNSPGIISIRRQYLAVWMRFSGFSKSRVKFLM